MTSTTSTLTVTELEAVRAAVSKAFKSWSHDLDENEEWFEDTWHAPHAVTDYGSYGPAIVWEDGSPYGWVHLTGGGIDEEFGAKVPAVELPEGVWLDPIDAIAVAVVKE